MPNLKIFSLICNDENITKDFYEKLIIRLLKQNLDIIKLSINEKGKNKYSKEELKQLSPNIINLNYNNIYIMKINDI